MSKEVKIDFKDTPTEIQEPGSRPVALDEVKKMIEEARLEVLKEAREEIQKQVQTDKVSLITVFGIFASIISLLAIDFQFLKEFNDPLQIIGFSLVLLASLLSFNIALDYLVKSRVDQETPRPHWWFLILVFFLFAEGIYLVLRSNRSQKIGPILIKKNRSTRIL